MMSTALWIEVGEILRKRREQRNITFAEVEDAKGGSPKTVREIEKGHPATIQALEEYAAFLGFSVEDVLRSALASRARPLSPEAAQVLRKFEQATIDGRQAFLALARAVPDASEPELVARRRWRPVPGDRDDDKKR